MTLEPRFNFFSINLKKKNYKKKIIEILQYMRGDPEALLCPAYNFRDRRDGVY